MRPGRLFQWNWAYRLCNGGSYEGEFKNSEANGKGTAVHPNGDILEGLWEDDYLIDGTFIIAMVINIRAPLKKQEALTLFTVNTFYNGQIYMGNWKGVRRHGLAEYWIDGSMYLGEHRNDQRDGPGIMYYPDGTQVGGFGK